VPKLLTPQQIEHYRREGYLSPIRAISTERALELRGRLEEFETSQGSALKGAMRHKSHLLFSWLNDLIREDGIVDAIEDLYGGNVLCWTTNFFIKERADAAFVSWHQDSTYWGLSVPDVVTAWVALSESTKANGAMQVIPRTHLSDQLPHIDTMAKNNLLTRGQEVAVTVNPQDAITLEMQPGEMSLHHVRLIHGSPANHSSERRIGFAIRYIPTYVRQLQGADSATLVRGKDQFGTFRLEPRPTRDFDPEFVAMHKTITDQTAALLLGGSELRALK
jgi:non-heme Fe2+,alpha-ketoglutarate-dependent halogenase